MEKLTALDVLTEILRVKPIPTVRVSWAPTSGRRRRVRYWGAVRYEVALNRAGKVTNRALGRAGADHRSETLAQCDALTIAEREGRIPFKTIGRLDSTDAAKLIGLIGTLPDPDIRKMAAARLRSVPRWYCRCLTATGLIWWFHLAKPALTRAELAAVSLAEARIIKLRRERLARKAEAIPVPNARRLVVREHGFELECFFTRSRDGDHEKRFRVVGHDIGATTRHDAIRCFIGVQPRRCGEYALYRTSRYQGIGELRILGTYFHRLDPGHESQRHTGAFRGMTWVATRNRSEVAREIRWHREHLRAQRATEVDPEAPDTLGWRVLHWDAELGKLVSPQMGTVWHTPELRVPRWARAAAVRGHAGIHAARMPRDWRRARIAHHDELQDYEAAGRSRGRITVTAVVERFGRYVLGTEGWRAEWVIIRKLRAPDSKTGLAIEKAYPDVEVYYEER